MNYVEFEISGVKRGWKFNNLAYLTFIKKVTGKDYVSAAPYAMFYGGLVASCFVKEVEEDFTFEQACDWADEIADNNPEAIKRMNEIFTSSTQFKELLERIKAIGEEGKKKMKKAGSTIT